MQLFPLMDPRGDNAPGQTGGGNKQKLLRIKKPEQRRLHSQSNLNFKTMTKDLEELKTRKEQGSSGMTKGRVYGQIIAFKISLCIGLLLKQKKK